MIIQHTESPLPFHISVTSPSFEDLSPSIMDVKTENAICVRFTQKLRPCLWEQHTNFQNYTLKISNCLSGTRRRIDVINKWIFLIFKLFFWGTGLCASEAKLLTTERKVTWVSTKILSMQSEKGLHVLNHYLCSQFFLIKLQLYLERFLFFFLASLLHLQLFSRPPKFGVCGFCVGDMQRKWKGKHLLLPHVFQLLGGTEM